MHLQDRGWFSETSAGDLHDPISTAPLSGTCRPATTAWETKRAINISAVQVTSGFDFRRPLAAADRTLGIVSHYAPGDDGGSDGLRFEWRDDLVW
jgi:hypothetical protein